MTGIRVQDTSRVVLETITADPMHIQSADLAVGPRLHGFAVRVDLSIFGPRTYGEAVVEVERRLTEGNEQP